MCFNGRKFGWDFIMASVFVSILDAVSRVPIDCWWTLQAAIYTTWLLLPGTVAHQVPAPFARASILATGMFTNGSW